MFYWKILTNDLKEYNVRMYMTFLMTKIVIKSTVLIAMIMVIMDSIIEVEKKDK